jgi:hypothetical protein
MPFLTRDFLREFERLSRARLDISQEVLHKPGLKGPALNHPHRWAIPKLKAQGKNYSVTRITALGLKSYALAL